MMMMMMMVVVVVPLQRRFSFQPPKSMCIQPSAALEKSCVQFGDPIRIRGRIGVPIPKSSYRLRVGTFLGTYMVPTTRS
jgi:hypothetical protein